MTEIATPTRAQRGRQSTRRATEAAESAKTMKRTRSQAALESEYESQSSDTTDDSSADQDFRPGRMPAAKKRGQAGRGAVKATSNSKATYKKSQRTSNTPQTSAKTATVFSSTAHPGKNVDLSSAISVKANLPPCNLGAIEFLTFFPLHIQWPELGLRLYRNEWNSLEIAKAMLHARNKLDYRNDHAVTKRRSANRHQVISNGKYFFNDVTFTPRKNLDDMTPVTTYDASNYAARDTFSVSSIFTAKLVDIAEGVVHMPRNEDRGIVTQAIEYAVRNDRDDLTTAHIPRLAAQHGFQEPSDALGARWDQHAMERIMARIELTGNYRKERFDAAFESETESDR